MNGAVGTISAFSIDSSMKRTYVPIAVCIATTLVLADTVYLKNDRYIAGIIIRESGGIVTVKVSVGEIDIPRDDIITMSRSSELERKKITGEWRSRKAKEPTVAPAPRPQFIITERLKRSALFFLEASKLPRLPNCNIPPQKLLRVPKSAKIVIYVPKGFSPNETMPLFFAMKPGSGNGGRAVPSYTGFADECRFIIAAPDLSAEEDNEEARYYYILYIINLLNEHGYTRNQPIWIGGFSGGGKWALQLGAYGGHVFSGILAIGCNEDYATLGLLEYKNNRALGVPIYLLNGTSDDIAGTKHPNYRNMISTMRQSGFAEIVVKTYEGGHVLPAKETAEAFFHFKRR